MSAQIRGIQPLQFGVTVTTGYVSESINEDDHGGQLLIEDEGGDYCTEITGFGLKTDVTLEVIPKSTATKPAQGDIFTYGAKKITVLKITSKEVRKDVMKWSIAGDRMPNVSLS